MGELNHTLLKILKATESISDHAGVKFKLLFSEALSVFLEVSMAI